MKKIGILCLIAILIGGGLYFAGWWKSRSDWKAKTGALETRLETERQDRSKIESELARLQSRNHLMRARVALYQTLDQLDRRNFGVAENRLKEADSELQAVDAARAGIDPVQLDAFRKAIAGVGLEVTNDLQVQRERILKLDEQLGGLMPK